MANFDLNFKYFRLRDHVFDDEFFFDEEGHPLWDLYEVKKIDREKEIVYAEEYEAYEPFIQEFPFSFFVNNDDVKILDTEKIEKIIKEEEEKRRERTIKFEKERKERERIENEEKNNHFKTLNPPLKRGDKVLLIGKYDRRMIDFSIKSDSFYIDDVKKDGDVFQYSLIVIGPRKNRGVYSFLSEGFFNEANLKKDLSDSSKPKIDFEVTGCVVKVN